MKVTTDRDIQNAGYSLRESRPDIDEMLHELIELRRLIRKSLAEHDFSNGNKGLIEASTRMWYFGCEWWNCRELGKVCKLRQEWFGEYSWVCEAHAKEGDEKGVWRVTNSVTDK